MPAKLVLGLFISFTIASSCSDPSTIGLELDPNNNQIGVSFVEIPLSASVVLQDSLLTTNPNRFVFGVDESDFFGVTTGTSYTRLFFNRDVPRPSSTAVLDSVKFNFNIRSVSAEDLTSEKTIRVHLLEEQIRDINYYNFNYLDYNPEPFLEAKLNLSARQDTIITVSAESDFTKKVFEDLKSGTSFQDIFSFREYLPGIVFTGIEGDNSSFSLQPGNNTGLVFFYRNDEDTVSRAYPIATGVNNNVARHFNQVERNPSGTPTEGLNEPWIAYDLGNKVGGMNNTGILVKIDTSPLQEFLDTLQSVTFNQVTLEIGPLIGNVDSKRPPQFLEMAYTNEFNRLVYSDNGLLLSVQPDNGIQFDPNTGNPFANASQQPALLTYFSDEKNYRQTLTTHVAAIKRGSLQRQDLLLWSSYRTVVQGNVAINDEHRRNLQSFIFNSNDVKLRIYYSTTRVF
ncbi:hypothetical protein EGN73_07820 [Arthrospiribacter ruber]|uniref:DUF4270 family protein n=1 Tax=Arthrospiribacter ruber TaxID=2487934 RepID=A0A951IY95_9BACT|nr:hypothetical protein [Arthrospiribacter ruber]